MLNNCQFIGRLGKAVEVKDTTSGKVANFSLAISEKWKDKNTGEKKEKTEWVRFSTFNENLINVLEKYTKVGDAIYCAGKFTTRKYTKQDGSEAYASEIKLEQVSLLPNSKGDDAPQEQTQPAGGIDDEVPF